MTTFLDTPIPVDLDPRRRDAINPALEYLSYVAWPEDARNRDRFVGSMRASIYKQVGWQVPPDLQWVKRERVAPVVRKAISRIHCERLPAALVAFARWAEQDLFDMAFADLTPDQQKGLASALAGAAARLRWGRSTPAIRRFHDMDRGVWRDARPALAMTMALPLSWKEMAFPDVERDEYREISLLFLKPGWVEDAILRAHYLSRCLERTISGLPVLRVPQRQVWRTDARLIRMRGRGGALSRLLNPKLQG